MDGSLKENLDRVKEKIAKELSDNAKLEPPSILAVSKKQPIEKIKALHSFGVQDFGENYLQEALQKIEALDDFEIRWHFIGKLQSKKIKEIVGHFHLIQTLTRSSEVEKIQQVCLEKGCAQNVLIQVNIANEESKQGVPPAELETLLSAVDKADKVRLCGLMFFPPLSDDEAEALSWFRKARQLFDHVKAKRDKNFKTLSMGTSHDYHLALRQGSNLLRIGESLMGPRL